MDKRINIVLDISKYTNFDFNFNLELLNDIKYLKYCINNNTYNETISYHEFSDNKKIIEGFYNKSIDYILKENLCLNNFINKFYGNFLNSKFISSNIKYDIINNLNIKSIYNIKNREVIIYSNKIENKYLKYIDSIFNFFDILTKKKNRYKLILYLSKLEKKINYENDNIIPDNINSGYTNGLFICIFRKEELFKVLFHEIIHYLKLDILNSQDKLLYLYNNINLDAEIINPNEGYTEALAVILTSIWRYNIFNNNFDIHEYFNLTIKTEIFWSFYQITKILKFFKCYNNYNELFKKKCVFKQKTNVLSYFFLKTNILYNINEIFKNYKMDNLKIDINNLLENINLNDDIYSNYINKVMNCVYNNNSFRMTLSF